MAYFNPKVTAHQVARMEMLDELGDLEANELCMAVNVDGMANAPLDRRAAYIANHIRMVQTNLAIEQAQQREIPREPPTILVAEDPEYWKWKHEQRRKQLTVDESG